MRVIVAILLALAAAGCDPVAAGGSFSGDNCAAGDATLDSLAISDAFNPKPFAVGDKWYPGQGDQGLPMSEFGLLMTGATIPPCVQVHARAENAVLDGTKNVNVKTGIIYDIRIGPVDDTYAIDATIAGLAAHLEIVHNVVSVVR